MNRSGYCIAICCWCAVFGLLSVFPAWTKDKGAEAGKPVCVDGSTIEIGYRQNRILDLVLIYQGGVQRAEWTPEEIRPYVMHTDRFGNKNWFYDGFLFLEFADGKGHNFAAGNKQNTSAKKSDWEWLIDRHFAEGKGIPALNGCIEKCAAEIGEPKFRHKVVISVAEPILDQKDWGELNGRAMDFSKGEDRIAACKWYINELIERFNESGLKYLDLVGIYWIPEEFSTNRFITPAIGDYVREKGMQFYYIPYYTANASTEWREYGFDMAYLQPNYFFTMSSGAERVDRACQLAYSHNMGMEMEFNGYVEANSKGSRRDRFMNYLRGFERNGVFKNSAIAYYEGGGALGRLSKSPVEADKIALDSLAGFVQERRKRFIEDLVYQVDFTQSNSLDRNIWNVSGDPKKIGFSAEGMILSGGKSSVKIDTKGKLDMMYGRVEVRARMLSKDTQAQIRIHLMPVDEKLGGWPKSGEIFLAHYRPEDPCGVRCGVNSLRMSENMIKESVFHIDELTKRSHTYSCDWKEKDITFYVDGLVTNIQEDLFSKSYSSYSEFWPFNEKFYLEISVESPSKEAAVCIESIKVYKE